MKARLMVCAAAASLLALAACSSGSTDAGTKDTSGSTASSAASSPELKAALTRVDAAVKEPSTVGVATPLSKTPATGKRIVYLTCGVGICKQLMDEMQAGAKSLGWTATRIDSGTTPEDAVAAWNRALTATPKYDAIITSGTPVSVYQKQLAQAAAAGIPVIDWTSGNPPGTPGITADILPITDNENRGKILADYAATETNGKAKVLFLNVPDYPVLAAEGKAFAEQLKANCPATCSSEQLNFAATDIGTKVPSATVSYLQSHPDVNFIVAAWDDLSLGVPEALKAATLDSKVKLISQSNNEVAATNIKAGNVQVATIPQGVGQMAYRALDVLARHFNGDSIEEDAANPLPIYLQTKETIGDPKNLWKGPPDYAKQYATLWKVSG